MLITILHDPLNNASRAIVSELGGEPAGNDATITHGGREIRIISDHALAVAACPNFSAYPAIVVKDGASVRVKSPVESWDDCLDFVDNPPAQPEAAKPRVISQFEFSQLFTADERKAIRAAAKVNADIEDAVDVLNRAQVVDLDLEATRKGVQGMEVSGILSAGRADRILANLPPVVA